MVTATKQLEVREAFLSGESHRHNGSAPPELPPSERDFLVFEAVAFGGASTRQTAAEFDISQTRVMQVRRHVARWIATSVPDDLDLTPIQRLRLAAHIAEGRVEFLYSQAIGAWKASQHPHTSVCRGRLTGETRTTRDSHGDPRYLLVAARISERQLSLAGTARKVMADAEDGSKSAKAPTSGRGDERSAVHSTAELAADATAVEDWTLTNGQGFEDREGEAPAEPRAQGSAFGIQETDPLDRACSPNRPDPTQIQRGEPESDDATDCEDEACNELENRRRAFLAALRDDTAPVHPPFTDAGGMLLDSSESVQAGESQSVVQLQVSGQHVGAALSTTSVAERPARIPLNRHQRRARQRELDRLRRRAK